MNISKINKNPNPVRMMDWMSMGWKKKEVSCLRLAETSWVMSGEVVARILARMNWISTN